MMKPAARFRGRGMPSTGCPTGKPFRAQVKNVMDISLFD
jgi:hypothetical protein